MKSAAPGTTHPQYSPPAEPLVLESVPRWQQFPAVPLALMALFLGLLLVPPVRENPKLQWTFVGVASIVIAWALALWAVARRKGQLFRIEYTPVKSHYVQATVQLCILAYWGYYSRWVYDQAALVFAQVLFLYSLEALITWSRGRTWRAGFGPLPIIFSTNLLLWFKQDWFYFQFAMIALGTFSKQFITWNRDGKRTHIFNPSAFGQSVVAVVLIATAMTKELTWGKEIASTFEVPNMLIVIFLLGLIVQYMFHVTLMTVAAAAVICLVDLVYHATTGVYFFVNINVAAPIFLGIHLLVTDPSTSPKTNSGRVLFGVLYGLGYCALFRIFDVYEIPSFWDKLLPVPILNLMVPLIDRWVRSGRLSAFNRRWETASTPGTLNLVHMGTWAALFVTLLVTRYVNAPHPGDSVPFWKQAFADGKPFAGHSLVIAAGSQAEVQHSGAAKNELGVIAMEGKIIPANPSTAAHYFAEACSLGNVNGCANAASQFLFRHERTSDIDVMRAFSQLERIHAATPSFETNYFLAAAHETGRGRTVDLSRAIALYERCGLDNPYACKAIARIVLSGKGPSYELNKIAPTLEAGCAAGDDESCWYLAYMHDSGYGVERDAQKARGYMEHACSLGAAKACEVLKQPKFPPFSKPQMVVPGWSTAFPLP